MDYLFGTPFQIEQPEEMYHFSSDSELLGRFLKIKPDDRVLDVGTNNGVLLLYAAMHKPVLLAGIDLFEEVIRTARRNLQENGIDAELTAVPLQEYVHEPFTRVICNPPFFTNRKNSLKKENRYLRAARHDDHLSLSDLFHYSAGLLKTSGSLSLILSAEKAADAFLIAGHEGFVPARVAAVYDREGGILKRILLEWKYQGEADLSVEAIRYLDRLHEDI